MAYDKGGRERAEPARADGEMLRKEGLPTAEEVEDRAPATMIGYYRFGEVVVLRFAHENWGRQIGEALVQGKYRVDGDEGGAFMAFATKPEFYSDPQAAQMIEESLKRAVGGFRGWWDMDPTARLTWDACYYCGALVWSEDGEHMAYECGAVCIFPAQESKAHPEEQNGRVLGPCPVMIRDKVVEEGSQAIAGEKVGTGEEWE